MNGALGSFATHGTKTDPWDVAPLTTPTIFQLGSNISTPSLARVLSVCLLCSILLRRHITLYSVSFGVAARQRAFWFRTRSNPRFQSFHPSTATCPAIRGKTNDVYVYPSVRYETSIRRQPKLPATLPHPPHDIAPPHHDRKHRRQ